MTLTSTIRSKILIIDDHEPNIVVLTTMLRKAGFCNIFSTKDSRECERLYQAIQPDLILLDLMMPHLSGFQVLELLFRLVPAYDYVPIMVLTSDISSETKQRVLELGANDFLTKPYDLIEVKLRIKNMLQLRLLYQQVQIQNEVLEVRVHERTQELTQAYDATIEGWSRILDLRDHDTEGHSERVCDMTMSLAILFDIPPESLIQIKRGALLHDIGKMGIPDSILLKPGSLNDEEWKVMRMHPVYAYEFLSPIPFLQNALEIPYCHHEKWDGSGYPRGLKGEDIPLAARIFAIVDVFDALVSDRPYRKAWPIQQALDYIQEQSGKFFDPEIVKIFIEKYTQSS